ncbi:ABC transporter permease [Shinella sp. CPCC 101442]|uniref:ABC transporter permease n=1 Tax=Shinella sp. CPCC 101442 TaxID=2932265 RepID=UPI0021525B66|nr:ABC transporter permease [Shinella sp. CPCC 101442]MCR6501421.1 ABC transporter permease [Shinella sp. CPCC 101442]
MKVVTEKNFAYALSENMRIIAALVVRSAVTRFGESRMGFVWVLIEPVAYVSVYLLIHAWMRAGVPFGDSALLFFLTGIFGFRMTRGIARKTERAIISNQPMLTYPLVRPLDTIIATFLTESTIWLIICWLFMGGLSLMMDRSVIVYPADFAEGLLAILYFALSFATFNAMFSALVPRYDTFMNMLSMPLMLASGVFFVPTQLPPEFQAILWWNPFLHCVEWFRTSTYLDYNALLSKQYLLGVSTGLLVIALSVERIFRRKIVAS